MVKGFEGDPRIGKGGVGLVHIIYHENYDNKKGTYQAPSTHLMDVAKRLGIVNNNMSFNFLRTNNGTISIDAMEVARYKNFFVPQYKHNVLNRIEQIIRTGTKISTSTILKHGEYNLDIESKKSEESWVYTDGNIAVFVRSNGFISNAYPNEDLQKRFITVITDGSQSDQQNPNEEAAEETKKLKKEYNQYLQEKSEYLHKLNISPGNFPNLTSKQFSKFQSKYVPKLEEMFCDEDATLCDKIIFLQREYQKYLIRYRTSGVSFPKLTLMQFLKYKATYADRIDDMPYNEIISSTEYRQEYQRYLIRYKESEARFPALTLKQFFEYKSKPKSEYTYAEEMDVMFYNKVVSLKEFENPDDFFTATELGFKSASDYYIWLGKISHTRINIPEKTKWHILSLINDIELETIPATYHKILLPNLNNNYKYKMFKTFTGRKNLTYNEYRDIINNLDD